MRLCDRGRRARTGVALVLLALPLAASVRAGGSQVVVAWTQRQRASDACRFLLSQEGLNCQDGDSWGGRDGRCFKCRTGRARRSGRCSPPPGRCLPSEGMAPRRPPPLWHGPG